ncbi:MAG: hypothetical protein HYT20_03375 [Candidatus Nealsonbacteria bacterium]|nr:hypothetical protein [Candidatus Nealsonbacteria bacterium]
MAEKQNGGLIKDVDFLVYGLDNFRKFKNGGLQKIREKLNLGSISREHIEWHAKKYGKYFQPGLTNFSETLKRKWPALQIGPGILSTIRFVYNENEVPPDPVISPFMAKVSIRGRVAEAERVSFMPRIFEISSTGNRTFKVVTYFWAFYCAVKEGDEVEVTGNLHQDGNLITLDNYYSGIKILN